jgi:hypothetical protein
LAALAPHRSGRARFTHPAPHIMVSLRVSSRTLCSRKLRRWPLNAIAGAFLASSAIFCSFVETVSGFYAPSIFPSKSSMLWRPLPSLGSPGEGSPNSPVLWSAPTPCHPSLWASLPSPSDTAERLIVRSEARPSAARLGPVESPAPPSGYLGGDDRVSQVPGEPQCVHALLSDPGGASV